MMILVIVLSIGINPVEAKQTEEKNKDEEIVQVKFSYIDIFQNSFKIGDNGKSSFSTILSSRNVDEARLTGHLQQYKDGKWKTIKTWSNDTNGTEAYLSGSWYISSGYSYRFKSYAYLYSEGKYVESTSYISGNIYH
jgi:hypothetical protein